VYIRASYCKLNPAPGSPPRVHARYRHSARPVSGVTTTILALGEHAVSLCMACTTPINGFLPSHTFTALPGTPHNMCSPYGFHSYDSFGARQNLDI
jgi:hypothetical protein